MNLLGITSGQRVADIGAGLGYYAVRLARRLGPGATIFATDVKVEYLNRLKERLTRERIAGVRVVLGLPRDPRLPPDSVDVAILSHMYHEIENPYEFLYASDRRWWPAPVWASLTRMNPRSVTARRPPFSAASWPPSGTGSSTSSS